MLTIHTDDQVFSISKYIKPLSHMISDQDVIFMTVSSFVLDPGQFLDLFEHCFPVLKTEWEELEVAAPLSLKEV